MWVGLHVISYAGRASEMSPHSLHGADQSDLHFTSQTQDEPMRGGSALSSLIYNT